MVLVKWLFVLLETSEAARVEQEDLFRLAGAERKNPFVPVFQDDPFSGSMDASYQKTGIYADVTEAAFFAAKGSLARTAADKIFPWYLKWWGTPGERAEYALGTVYRWVTENPKTTIASAAAVTSGLLYYWYRSKQRSTETVVEEALRKALNSTNLTEDMEKKAPDFQNFVASGELQAARTVVLEAAAEGECLLTKTHSKEVVKRATIVKMLQKKAKVEEAKLAPLSARCNGRSMELSWNGPTQVLILQLNLLKIFAANTHA